MTDMAHRPVVALELDGVLRIPGSPPDSEVRPGTVVAEVTMRRTEFPSYTHVQPPWDESGEWAAWQTFSGTGMAWIKDLVARGVDIVWVSSWGAYVNVYFADPLGMPQLPFMDGAVSVGGASVPLGKVRWLTRQFEGRPLLWVTADANPETVASLRKLRSSTDRARTRVFVVDRYVGVTTTDAAAMDGWLEVAGSEDGQAELRRQDRRRERGRAARAVRDRWGSQVRYRRWRSARDRLAPLLGSESVLLTLLADYALQSEDVESAHVARIRAEWGRPTDPPADALWRLIHTPRGRRPRINILSWAGSGYPPGLGGILSRGHANGLRTLDVGRGWWPLLNSLDDQLARIDPDYSVDKVRSFHGRLQFEATSTEPDWYAPAFAQLIRAAQRRAARTCERCARPGVRREGDGGHAAVLCDAHSRPLTDEEIAFALAGGVPPELLAGDGALEGVLFADIERDTRMS